MKIFSGSLLLIFTLSFIIGCTGKGPAKKETQTAADSIPVPDTGYTGIKKYMSGTFIVKEVTFKNGVREGLMKTFYQNGKVTTDVYLQEWLKRRFIDMVLPGGAKISFYSIQKRHYRWDSETILPYWPSESQDRLFHGIAYNIF